MPFSDESYNLRIELDTKGCELSAAQIEEMEDDLDTLRVLVEDFPVSDLKITIVHHARSDDYHVKTTLALPGRKLFTGDRNVMVHPAFESCVRKLIKKVRAYKSQMRVGTDASKQAEGTRQMVNPSGEADVNILSIAVDAKDYSAFRHEIDVFEPALTERIGRWVQRYPELLTQLGSAVSVSDIVEEVFLNAFEHFATRSHQVSPGDWLESLIDPSIQALLQSPDEEFERIRFSKSTFGE